MTTCSGSNNSSTRLVGRGSDMPRWLIDSLATGGPALVVADAVAKATILLCLTTAVAAVLRRSAAAVRHRLWSLTLCGLIVLPFLSWCSPAGDSRFSLQRWGCPVREPPGMREPRNWGLDQAVNAGSPDGIPRRNPTSIVARPGRHRHHRQATRPAVPARLQGSPRWFDPLWPLAPGCENPPGSCSSGCWGSSQSRCLPWRALSVTNGDGGSPGGSSTRTGCNCSTDSPGSLRSVAGSS